MYYKHPRTYHLDYSLSLASDDKFYTNIYNDMSHFIGKRIVVTEKMDGENTTFYRDYFHARSIDSNHNFTRDWCKKLHSIIKYDIPIGWRISGENVSYYHSIKYDNLISYFYMFMIWDEHNNALSYDELCEWSELLDLAMPKLLYDGIYDESKLIEISKNLDYEKSEGFVIRIADSFNFSDFSKCVAKFVRPNHVQSNEHWLKNTFQNQLITDLSKLKPKFMFKNPLL